MDFVLQQKTILDTIYSSELAPELIVILPETVTIVVGEFTEYVKGFCLL